MSNLILPRRLAAGQTFLQKLSRIAPPHLRHLLRATLGIDHLCFSPPNTCMSALARCLNVFLPQTSSCLAAQVQSAFIAGTAIPARLIQAPPLRHRPATREQNPSHCYPQLKAISRSVAILVKCGLKRDDCRRPEPALPKSPGTITRARLLKGWPLCFHCALTSEFTRAVCHVAVQCFVTSWSHSLIHCFSI